MSYAGTSDYQVLLPPLPFLDGFRFSSPPSERFSNKFATHLGFPEEAINSPLCSVVTFVNKEFVGPLVDFSKSYDTLPGNMFITAMEGSLEMSVCSARIEVTEGELRSLF